jgi:hypothetical protein
MNKIAADLRIKMNLLFSCANIVGDQNACQKKKQSISPNANGFLPAPYVVVLSSNWYIYIVRATNYESIA